MNKNKVKSLVKKYKKGIIAIGLIIAIGGGIILIKLKGNSTSELNSIGDYVRTVSLEKSSIYDSIAVNGKIESAEVTSVTSALAEKIKTVNVKVGDLVKKGDIIAVLDDTSIKKEIENKKQEISSERQRLKSSYDKDVNSLNTAKSNKAISLAEQDKLVGIAKQNLDSANNELETYKESFQSEESKYNTMLGAIREKKLMISLFQLGTIYIIYG